MDDRDFNNKNIEDEKKQFEEELEEEHLRLSLGGNNKKPDFISRAYQNNYKKLYTYLLISAVLFVIMFIGMKFYTAHSYKQNQEEYADTYSKVIQIVVNNYRADNKGRCPKDSLGNIDIYTLKNKGYLNPVIEKKSSSFTLTQTCQVVPKTTSADKGKELQKK